MSFSDDRGWVSSQYLEYLYRNHYVYLPDYVDEIDVPVVPFALASYWSSYYEGRPWYRRHAYWNNYWTSHQRLATQMTIDPRAARIGRAATRDAAVALGREGVHARGNVNGNVRSDAAVSGRDAATARHDAAIGRRNAAVTTDRARVGQSERFAHERVQERANVQGRNPRDAQARMMHEQAAGRAAVRAAKPNASAAPPAQTAAPARPCPADYAGARPEIVALNRVGKLNDSTVNRFAIRGETASLFTALSVLSGAPIEVVERIMADGDCEGLVMACRASRLNWATTLAILSNRSGTRLSFAERERAHHIYETLLLSTSQWTVRWGEIAASAKANGR
ncbi:DUF2336 domain-containing protein [Bradyrhizobium sp. SEMIA]|uniref:DUF2336 domain-containing protein n=1 Tax=Bradyrhizobium sp. SEMIA TaxID=2597515 RepID=UPI00223FF85F|nr:DUF2336 domain-containing protein [Bradyrhizobium sp. SEMIA]